MPSVRWNSRRRWRATMPTPAPIRSSAISVMCGPGVSRHRRRMRRILLLDAACCWRSATHELPTPPLISCRPTAEVFGPLRRREAARRTAISCEQEVSPRPIYPVAMLATLSAAPSARRWTAPGASGDPRARLASDAMAVLPDPHCWWSPGSCLHGSANSLLPSSRTHQTSPNLHSTDQRMTRCFLIWE